MKRVDFLRNTAMRLLLSLVAAWAFVAPGAALAGCAGSEALDRCVIGGWRSSGNGAAEWMKRNMPPGMVMLQNTGGGTIVFEADGTYRSVFSASQATERGSQTEGRMEGTTSGRWSVSDGFLNMCTDAQDVAAQIQITAPDGAQSAVAFPVPAATRPVSQAYRCAGDQLETQMTFPGIADPMTTRYSRIDPAALAGE